MTDGMGTLDDAIAWARDHWVLPEAPARIHQHAVEPDSALGSPKMSPAFLRYLAGSDFATAWREEEHSCLHPTGRLEECCQGAGTIRRSVEYFLWPMAAALTKLGKMPNRSALNPSYLTLVIVLAHVGWSVPTATALCGISVVSPDHARTIDALFLSALRELRSRYRETPVGKPVYTELSESQRNAMHAA